MHKQILKGILAGEHIPDEKTALLLTADLWHEIAVNGYLTKGQSEFVKNRTFLHDCPLCHYVVQNNPEVMEEVCSTREVVIISFRCTPVCPMRELWPKGCEAVGSPFHDWLFCCETEEKRKFFAFQIANFAAERAASL